MNDNFDMDEILQFWEDYFNGQILDLSGEQVIIKEDW